MAHTSHWWRCLLGHRWGWIDSHVYELGRGYEIAYDYEECARCGTVRETGGSVILPRPPRGAGAAEHGARIRQEG